jgi:hypothetical protein
MMIDSISRQAPAFAVVHTWPKIKNAEYEIIQRVIKAANNIGVTVYVVDDNGYIIQSNGSKKHGKRTRIQKEDCEFLLSLHFESPRVHDIFSYAALWNPLNFYSMFGYHASTEKLASHNDVLSCRSDIADAHAANLFEGMGREIQLPPPAFFHTVPGPLLKPKITKDSRLFYIGINWERISGKKGRHHDLLKWLDDERLIQIYGPEIFQGVEPWKDFNCYCGSIPFDGHSVLERINAAGICLVLSSESHQRSGIMSSRLFEGLAAGAVIICNPHPLVEKYFSDCVYLVDESLGPLEFSKRVRELVLEIRKNPSVALERAERGQKRFYKEGFNLEHCLSSLFQEHSSRKAHFDKTALGERQHVSVLLNYPGFDLDVLEQMISNVTRQRGVDVDLVLLNDSTLVEKSEERIRAACTGSNIRMTTILSDRVCSKDDKRLRAKSTNPLFARGLKSIATEFFCTIQPDDYWFEDHLATLAQALHKQPDAQFSCSGRITESVGPDGKLIRTFEELTMRDFVGLIDVSHPRDVGRFLYRSDLIKKLPHSIYEILPIIDGQEHRLLNLWASIDACPAQTNYATYVHLDHRNTAVHTAYMGIDTQVEMIRDSVRGSSDWLIRLSDVQQLEKTISGLRVWPKTRFDRFPRVEKDRMYILHQARLSRFLPFDGESAWIEGVSGVFQFDMDAESEDGENWLVLVLAGRNSMEEDEAQKCTIYLNDIEIASVFVSERLQQRYFKVPESCVSGTSLMRVELKLAHAEPMIDSEGKTIDPRLLGLRVHSFGIWSKRPTLQLEKDRIYDFRRDIEEIRPAINGFYEVENGGTWIDGTSATIQLETESDERKSWLTFIAAGRKSNLDGSNQQCTISINGTVVSSIDVPEKFKSYELEIPDEVISDQMELELNLKHAGPVLDQRGKKIDRRNLGLRLKSFGIITDRSLLRLLKNRNYDFDRYRAVRVLRRLLTSFKLRIVKPQIRAIKRRLD